MVNRRNRNHRTWHRARRIQRILPRKVSTALRPHSRAIEKLRGMLVGGTGLHCWFHGGVSWRAFKSLIQPGTAVAVEREKLLRAAGKRYYPDLTIRCASSGRILLVIEVWHCHVVGSTKRKAFNAEGLPWVEMKASHILEWIAKRPLVVIDWGGLGVDSPDQGELFRELSSVAVSANPQPEAFLASWQEYSAARFPLARLHQTGAPRPK